MASDETNSVSSSTAALPATGTIPSQIGPYRILEILGGGGMGTVYKAEQRIGVKRIVALKLIKPGFDTAEVIARFQSERQALARMDHPHVAKVLDAGADELGRPYFVMEYVPGAPMTRFADEKKLAIRDRLELFIQVCQAIAHAHTKAIIHRDIKASNVLAYLADGKPFAKVIDFGIAKALTTDRLTDQTFNTDVGKAVGTYEYMSPEQAEGSPDIDTRTDVYSLGVLLYELLAGAKPFEPNTFARFLDHEMRRIIREEEPPRPSTRLSSLGEQATRIAAARRERLETLTRQLRSELEWIPLMAMRKERDRRYAGPLELARDIENYLENRPLRAGPESIAYRWQKYLARNKARLSAAAAILILLIAGTTTSTILALRARRAEKTVAAQLEDVKSQRNEAIAANARADRESASLRRELSEHFVDEGLGAWKRDDPAVAMLWFVKALNLDAGDPVRETSQRIRLGTSLEHCPRPLDVPPPRGLDLDNRDRGFAYIHPRIRDNRSEMQVQVNAVQVRIYNEKDFVTCVSFSSDAKRVLVGHQDRTARVFDAVTGEPLTPHMQTSGQPRLAKLSDDQTRVFIACDDNTGRIWNVSNGNPVCGVLNLESETLSAVFTRNNKLLVTCGDHLARVWDCAAGSRLATLPHNGRFGMCAAFSPDGAALLTAVDGELQLWRAQSGEPMTPPMQFYGPPSRLKFSPDGRYIVAVGHSDARLWDASTGKPFDPPLRHDERYTPIITDATVSPDGEYVITTGEDRTAHLWLTGGIAPGPPMEHIDPVIGGVFSDDGKRIATMEYRSSRPVKTHVSLWPVRVWEARWHPPRSHTVGMLLEPAEYSVNGDNLLYAGRIWSLASGKPITALSADMISHSLLSPDGKYALTCGDNRAQVWQLDGQPRGAPMRHAGRVNYASFSADGTRIVTASDDKTARVWDAKTGQPISPAIVHSSQVRYASLSPDGKFVVTSAEKIARIWNSATAAPASAEMPQERWWNQAFFSPDGQRIITLNASSARIWDLAGAPLTPPMEHDSLTAATFSPNGKFLITMSSKQGARVWDTDSGKPLAPPMSASDEITAAAFTPDNKYVLTEGHLSLTFWETATGKRVTPTWVARENDVQLEDATLQQKFIVRHSLADVIRALPTRATALSPQRLEQLAQLISCQRIDSTGALVRLDRDEWTMLWDHLRSEIPEFFRPSN